MKHQWIHEAQVVWIWLADAGMEEGGDKIFIYSRYRGFKRQMAQRTLNPFGGFGPRKGLWI